LMCYGHPNQENSLRIAPEILCSSDAWFSLMPVTVLMIITYIVFPICVLLFILAISPRRFSERNFRIRWCFLFAKFRADYWWWLPCNMFRSVALALVLAVAQQAALQLYLIIVVLMVYIIAVAANSPWRHSLVNYTETFACTVLALIGAMSLWLIPRLGSEGLDSLSGAAVTISYFPLALAIACMMLFGMWTVKKESDPALSAAKKLTEEMSALFPLLSQVSDEDLSAMSLRVSSYDTTMIWEGVKTLKVELVGQKEHRLSFMEAADIQPPKLDTEPTKLPKATIEEDQL